MSWQERLENEECARIERLEKERDLYKGALEKIKDCGTGSEARYDSKEALTQGAKIAGEE